MPRDALKRLPAIDRWLQASPAADLCAEFGRDDVVDVMRAHLDRVRARVIDGGEPPDDFESADYFQLLRADLIARRVDSFTRVINATGIVVHTNLGRSPLADEAIDAIRETAGGYSNLELDLATGKRGSRYQHVEGVLTRLTGAEAAVVVNNCAAAVVLCLNTFCRDAEVVVSRGELIEIGGSFRMPDVIALSKARMKEVGTTNKTRLEDYAAAIGDQTQALLTSHPSNYRITGFTASPSLAELAQLAHDEGRVLIQDLGSGTLVDVGAFGLTDEPTVQASVEAGADLVTFSGDKLLGGPQAGIIVGRAELIASIKKNALLRALRIDKLSLAALNATLRLYLPPSDPMGRVPVLRMLSETKDSLAERSQTLVDELAAISGLDATLVDDESFAGGGALPMQAIPSVAIELDAGALSADELAARLRAGEPPVIGRITEDRLRLSLRTVLERDLADLAPAIERAVQ